MDDDTDDARDDDFGPPQDSGVARAEAAIHAIAAGADPGAEALNVSNRFTDELTSRVRAMLRRGKRRDGKQGGRSEPGATR